MIVWAAVHLALFAGLWYIPLVIQLTGAPAGTCAAAPLAAPRRSASPSPTPGRAHAAPFPTHHATLRSARPAV